jgi:hypothetical protein
LIVMSAPPVAIGGVLEDRGGRADRGGGGHGHAGLIRQRARAGRGGLQVRQVVTGVHPNGVRDVVESRNAAEQVEQVSS